MSEWQQFTEEDQPPFPYEPRFGLDQWHIIEDDNLASLERWPETEESGPAKWQVVLVAKDPMRFDYRTTDPSLGVEEAFAWASEQRDNFLAKVAA